jgi:hypothetical protein
MSAIVAALILFADAFRTADASLKQYAAQKCPDECPDKVPPNPVPVYTIPHFPLSSSADEARSRVSVHHLNSMHCSSISRRKSRDDNLTGAASDFRRAALNYFSMALFAVNFNGCFLASITC